MRIEVKLDAGCGTTVVIHASCVNDEVQQLVRRLSQDAPQVIVGFREDEAVILTQEEILRAYTEGGKVYAETTQGKFSLRQNSMSWRSGWTGRDLCASPIRKSSISAGFAASI